MPGNRRVRAVAVGASILLTLGLFSVDYTVKRGDTLKAIAQDHEVSLTELIELNELDNPDFIYPGQVLHIPGEDTQEPQVIHVVVRGDTLGLIAARYGSSISALVEANSIDNPDFIVAGQEITIPGATSTVDDEEPSVEADPETEPTDSSIRTGRYHIVQRGEDLDSIAARHEGTTADQIAGSNGIIDGVIYTGTRLFLDGPAFVAEGTEGLGIYEVVRGDRLGDIAAANGTTVQTLVELNDIPDPNFILTGQRLVIPTGHAWACPVEGASFFNDWGFPRGGGTSWHEGNDLFADQGTPVFAAVGGEVLQKTGTIGGYQVNLSGDDGVLYIHSHLSAFGEAGTVRAGDIIGYVGTTGSAQGTPPHVHFMMYLEGGIVVNPYPSLIAHGCRG